MSEQRSKKRPNGKGTYYLKGKELYGKWTATVDGVDVRVCRKLGTQNELVAKRLVEECARRKCDLRELPSRSPQVRHARQLLDLLREGESYLRRLIYEEVATAVLDHSQLRGGRHG